MSKYLLAPGLYVQNTLRLAFRPEALDSLPEKDYREFLQSLHDCSLNKKDWPQSYEILRLLVGVMPPSQDLQAAYFALAGIALGLYNRQYNSWMRSWLLYDALRLGIHCIDACLQTKTDVGQILVAYEELSMCDSNGRSIGQAELRLQSWSPRHPVIDQILIATLDQDDFFKRTKALAGVVPTVNDLIRENILPDLKRGMSVVIEHEIRERFVPLLSAVQMEVQPLLEMPHLPTRDQIGELIQKVHKLAVLVDPDNRIRSGLRQVIRRLPRPAAVAEEWIEFGQFLQIAAENLQTPKAEDCQFWNIGFFGRILLRLAEITAGTLSGLRKFAPVLRIVPDPRLYPLRPDAGLVTVKATLSNSESGALVPELSLRIGETPRGITMESIEPNHIGELKPGENFPLFIRIRCTEPARFAAGELLATFQDPFGNSLTQKLPFRLEGQTAELNWQTILASPSPYRLAEIKEQNRLYGRKEQLDTLIRSVLGYQSVIIYGQKRTGKSSLGRVLYHDIMPSDHRFKEWASVYTDFGEIGSSGGSAFATYVGRQVFASLTRVDPGLLHKFSFPEEEIKTEYNRLVHFLRKVFEEARNLSALVIIDEFDEMHPRYYLGEEGRSFFLFLRSLENLERLVFVFIGGERVPLIDRTVGSQLNRARSLPLDYLEVFEPGDRDRISVSLEDLIRRPSASVLTFSDAAVRAVAESSAGNPYFAVYICNELFNRKVQRYDSYVDTPDVMEAVEQLVNQPLSKQFAHFWQDGHLQEGDAEVIEGRNIITLLAVADAQQKADLWVQENDISRSRFVKTFGPPLRDTLEKLVSRRVLLRSQEGYRVRVPFFWEWLRQAGLREVLLEHRKAVEEHLRVDVRDEAILDEKRLADVVARFETYQGRRVEEFHVRRWLKQFGPIYKQNLALKVLSGVRVYSEADLRQRVRTIHGEVGRAFAQSEGKELDLVAMGLAQDKSKQHVPVKSFIGNYFIIPLEFEGVGSGSYMADLYRRTNNIWRGNVLPMDRALDRIEGVKEKCVILLVDDFICTGRTAKEAVKVFLDKVKERGINQDLHLVCLAAAIVVESALERLQESEGFRRIKILYGEMLGEEAKAFSGKAGLFADDEERSEARQMFLEIGKKLEPRAPLGFDASEALVVFERNCPNNSLPPFYKKTKDWEPLFQRA